MGKSQELTYCSETRLLGLLGCSSRMLQQLLSGCTPLHRVRLCSTSIPLLVHVVERGHSRMRLVNRMEAQVSVEGPPLLSHCFVHKGEEMVNNERSIVSGYFCSELVDTARVGRVWIVVIGARVAPVGRYATTSNTLIAIWCYVVVA